MAVDDADILLEELDAVELCLGEICGEVFPAPLERVGVDVDADGVACGFLFDPFVADGGGAAEVFAEEGGGSAEFLLKGLVQEPDFVFGALYGFEVEVVPVRFGSE